MSNIDDFDKITLLIKTLIEGEAEGDVSKLREAFHQDARLFGHVNGERYDIPVSEYFDIAASAPANSEGNHRARIISVNQFGDAAHAVVAEDGSWGVVSFIDLLSLARIDSGWKVVNKTFCHTGGEMPAL